MGVRRTKDIMGKHTELTDMGLWGLMVTEPTTEELALET